MNQFKYQNQKYHSNPISRSSNIIMWYVEISNTHPIELNINDPIRNW